MPFIILYPIRDIASPKSIENDFTAILGGRISLVLLVRVAFGCEQGRKLDRRGA